MTFGFEIEAKGLTPGLMKQVHGAALVEKDGELRDREADGVYTQKNGEEVFVFTADCLPVLFAGREGVAAVHAGWRGTKLGIIGAMLARFQLDNSLKIVLGPCLKSCCFEVKEDFVKEFELARGEIKPFLSRRDGKQFFDLVGFVLARDLKNIPRTQIDLNFNRCTFCSEPKLPSYRRNKGTDPRIRAWIRMN